MNEFEEEGSPLGEEEREAADNLVKGVKALEVLVASLERRIGIKRGYFWTLMKEGDDWAFIVKLSVICEAALTHALVLKVGNPQLFDHFSELTQARRLELAKQFQLLSDDNRHTLAIVAQVRNSFAHRVENLGGSLEAYFLSRTKDQQIDLISKLLQLSGQDKPRKEDDTTQFAPRLRAQMFAHTIRPLVSLASTGIALDPNMDEQVETTRLWVLGMGEKPSE